MSYAVIRLGGKQYRVAEGQRLLVDRLPHDEGKTFHPETLLVGGDGPIDLEPGSAVVTARVVGHVLGDKVRIGKYKRRTGYKRHNGHRSRLSQIEVESVGAKRTTRQSAPKADAEKKAAPEVKQAKQVKDVKQVKETKAVKAPAKKATAAAEKKPAKPAAEKKASAKPTAEKKTPARKPAARKWGD
jgi:large subunit ribosomal protein L21